MRNTPWLAMVVWGIAVLPRPAGAQGDWQARLEADWLKQEERRRMSPTVGNATTKEDALGAVDGVKDGKWGFHTALENQPWWQVDLGQSTPLGRIVVYARCDGGCEGRTTRMVVVVSDDAQTWTQVHDCNGAAFGGVPNNNPLVVKLDGKPARYVRMQLPHEGYFHLDEVEIYAQGDDQTNIALWKPADQSSISPWSVKHDRPGEPIPDLYPVKDAVARGLALAGEVAGRGVDTKAAEEALRQIGAEEAKLPEKGAIETRRALYLQARRVMREVALRDPLLDFDRILFVKRAPTSYSHMSDQNYGWWSRPGGGIYVLSGFRTGEPQVTCLTEGWPVGNFNGPDLSYDGTKVLFAYCKYYPESAGNPNKVDKGTVPEDAFYHVFEMNVDGSGVRQITHGKYDDFDPRYLPNDDILFLSTRRGQSLRCTTQTAMSTLTAALPDCYVRCGGDASRPVAVYTLHVMDPTGEHLRPISAFESFEWTPSVSSDGRILYARWDYVDRSNMPFMKLWSTFPDGTHPSAVYGNFTWNPHCAFEARSIPGSDRLVFTASAHHSITAGSLVLLDPNKGLDGNDPITRLTPEVCFPEAEGWPASYYANPWPLSESTYLCAWSNEKLAPQGQPNPINAMGIYLFDAGGNLELLYRDPDISSMYPLPLKPRARPPMPASSVHEPDEGRMLLLNVYDGLPGIARDAVKALRIVGVPAKTQPNMNTPNLGVTSDDPGKVVLGTVPVEADGSAYFHLPAGVNVFFQALDKDGLAIQTMRTITYAQPGQTLSCVGCHEPRETAPSNAIQAALHREPSRITPGPEGSWPLRFDQLVQPVLDRQCVRCHRPDSTEAAKSPLDLTPGQAYESLVSYGAPSLRDHVRARYGGGRSVVGEGAAATSALLKLLRAGHRDVTLAVDDTDRLVTWMDTYAQVRGSFSEDQEQRLRDLRADISWMLADQGE
ncbi:MAG: hypothetical protein FJX75_26635 [Armatimonadetes bacterium]|nr:hypothetical protein [Armatimonadota bacterium]